MDLHDLLYRQAEEAYRELRSSLEGVSEGLAWARLELQPEEYLHTEGSILSMVVHLAGVKMMYGGWAFQNRAVRYRDVVSRIDRFWPSWAVAQSFLDECHRSWLHSWATETNFSREVEHPSGGKWPAWKLISLVNGHDLYHAGQIQVLRSSLAPTDQPPASETDDWRKYCEPLESW